MIVLGARSGFGMTKIRNGAAEGLLGLIWSLKRNGSRWVDTIENQARSSHDHKGTYYFQINSQLQLKAHISVEQSDQSRIRLAKISRREQINLLREISATSTLLSIIASLKSNEIEKISWASSYSSFEPSKLQPGAMVEAETKKHMKLISIARPSLTVFDSIIIIIAKILYCLPNFDYEDKSTAVRLNRVPGHIIYNIRDYINPMLALGVINRIGLELNTGNSAELSNQINIKCLTLWILQTKSVELNLSRIETLVLGILFEEKSKEKSTFASRTVFLHFNFNVFPFEITNPRSSFEGILYRIFDSSLHCQAYLDDIIIFSKTSTLTSSIYRNPYYYFLTGVRIEFEEIQNILLRVTTISTELS
ncbi:hypothetical protein RF11_11323 [Thelohanellus kitauei]|uniref:Reverse transcriptase domain-containing protein n=1 Tax=Thelohanellus kitauei TaxID=669202 RepID=A0A0C2I7Q2_THEKT|nr:hypothetical protein RF11_11323 [Thelohanellus kitauei]